MKSKILIGLVLIFGLIGGIASAVTESEYGVEINMLTYTTPQDVPQNNNTESGYNITLRVDVHNIPSWAYPVNVKYYYDNNQIFNSTMESGTGNYGEAKTFHMTGVPDFNFKQTEVQLISANGRLIGLADKYEPVYTHDLDQKKFDLELVSVNISKINNDGILGFLQENKYETSFLIKNTNESFAFSGTIEIGDFGVMSQWKANKTVTLGPRFSVEIKGPVMTDKDLKDLKTEVQYHPFS